MYFWMKKKRISVGTIPSVAEAIKLPQSIEYCCFDFAVSNKVLQFGLAAGNGKKSSLPQLGCIKDHHTVIGCTGF
jgi:hypothetical protein